MDRKAITKLQLMIIGNLQYGVFWLRILLILESIRLKRLDVIKNWLDKCSPFEEIRFNPNYII
jgi:hypothetical protein